jgi:ribosome biogenesis protein ERB1
VPSKHERLRVQKILKALKEGRMKTLEEKRKEREEKLQPEEDRLWDIWEDDTIVPWRPKDAPKQIHAPKRDLPQHAESYNPPEEYLLDEDEKKAFEEMDDSEKPYNFLPQKFDSLRKVPLYQDLIREHFERCLDLYMCPRMMRKKVNVQDPNTLIPELPSPNDLKPFPTMHSVEYAFHKTCVRSISLSPCGRYLASGDEDFNVVIWEVGTARILRKYKVENKVVDCVAWSPSKTNCVLAVSNEELVYVFCPALYSKSLSKQTEESMASWANQYSIDVKASDTKEKYVKWSFEKDY